MYYQILLMLSILIKFYHKYYVRIIVIILKMYLNRAVSDNSVFKWRDSNFFSSANRTHALAYPICVLMSVIA